MLPLPNEDVPDLHGHDVEIDDEPVLSVADEGVWVSAWVWVQRTHVGEDGERN